MNLPPQLSTNREIDLWQLLNYFYTYRLFVAVLTFAVPAVMSAYLAISKPIYRTSVYVNIDLSRSEKDAKTRLPSPFGDPSSTSNKISLVEQYFESPAIKSLALKILSDPADASISSAERRSIMDFLQARPLSNKQRADAIFANLNLNETIDKNRLELTSAADHPFLATALANLGASCLLKINHSVLIHEITAMKDFLRSQTDQTRLELSHLESQLVEIQSRAHVYSAEDMGTKVNNIQAEDRIRLADLNRQETATKIMIAETEHDIHDLKGLLAKGGGVSQLYVDQVQRRLEVLRYQRAQATSQTDSSSAVSDPIEREIATVQKDLDTQLAADRPLTASPWDYIKKLETSLFELKQKRTTLAGELKAYRTSLASSNPDFASLPKQLRELVELKRNIDLTSSLYVALKTREQDTAIREAARANDLVVVAPAFIPVSRSGVGFKRAILLSLFGGFSLSLFLLLARYLVFPLVRDGSDLKQIGFQHLGGLPRIRQPGASFSLRASNVKRLRLEDGDGRYLYGLDLIRLRLQQSLASAGTGKASVITFHSACLNGGRTFFAVNLADLFASKNKKVCLLDLNVGSIRARNFFELNDSDFNDHRSFAGLKIALAHPEPGLDLLEGTAPGRSLSSYNEGEFIQFLASLRETYDLVIIDAPEVQLHAESLVLLQNSDAVVTIVNQRSTLVPELKSSYDFIKSMTAAETFSIVNHGFDEIRPRTL